MKTQFSLRRLDSQYKDMFGLLLVGDQQPFIYLQALGVYRLNEPMDTEMQAMTETLNRHHKIENYFLLRDLNADSGNSTIGVIGSGKLETTEQKDEFISKLLKVFTEHYDAEDCGIDSIDAFFENYLMYGKEYQSGMWYQNQENGGETLSVQFTIEKISLY